MFAYYWPIGLLVLSNVFYHITAKSLPWRCWLRRSAVLMYTPFLDALPPSHKRFFRRILKYAGVNKKRLVKIVRGVVGY